MTTTQPRMQEAGTSPESPRQPQRRTSRRAVLLQRLGFIVLILIAIAGVYYFIQYQRLSTDPAIEAREEATRVAKELSRIMYVPEGELPIVATVSDKEQLAGQPFFTHAENGDQVIIFASSMRAVLYRPSTRKVVDMAPLATAAGPQTPQSQPLPQPAASPAPETATQESSIVIE